MRSFHERKRHNEVAMGLSFVAVALLVLGFMGMAQHLELTAFCARQLEARSDLDQEPDGVSARLLSMIRASSST